MGRIGKMRSSIKGESIGSVELLIQQDVIRLNVKSVDGSEIRYDDEVTIVDEAADKKYYYVQKNINLNNF